MTDQTLPVIIREFNHVAIGQRSDGYLNATAMCKAAGKEWSGYARNASTDAFLTELESVLQIRRTDIVMTIQGGKPEDQGTWVHPQVGYHLAMWCSPAFAVKVTEWVDDIKRQGYATVDRQPIHPVAVDVRRPEQLAAIALQLVEYTHELEETVRRQSSAIAIAAPKAEFYDAFANADGGYTLQNAARVLDQKIAKFMALMKDTYMFYQGGALVPRAEFIDAGLFTVKTTMVNDVARHQSFITPKGIQFFGKKLKVGQLALL